jgi:hypothetical protein
MESLDPDQGALHRASSRRDSAVTVFSFSKEFIMVTPAAPKPVTQTMLDAAKASGTSSVGTIDVNSLSGGSLQLIFAKLQLVLSGSAKANAMKYIEDIQNTQEEQKQLAAFLQEARQRQANAKKNGVGCPDGVNTEMPANMKAYMLANSLARGSTDDDWNSKDEWEVNIKSLQARMDALGTDTQQKMVFVQDYMSQYSNYLTGANSVIQQGNQTLGELAKAR